ncbi:MAG: ATP-grasp domain-containing protein [Actinobacteria bacterium]|nr:ATP-grasp domain-containing protein [Actinomycetota bacterium]
MKQNEPIVGTVLITGCGGDIGQSLARILKMKKAVKRLIGCDIHHQHPGHFIYDWCGILPTVRKPDYLKRLLEILKSQKVDLVIPMSEPELRFYSENGIREVGGVLLLMSNEKSMEIGFDKLATVEFLKRAGLPHPWTVPVEEGKPKELPCVLKKRGGSGGKELQILNKDEFERLQPQPGMIFQELLEPDDQEYTCSVFRTPLIKTRVIILRRRLTGGFTTWAEVIQNATIEKLLHAIAESLDLHGSINVQLRLTDNGPVVFEINPRFSSTVMLRHIIGFQNLIWAVQDLVNVEIDPYTPPATGTEVFKGYQEFLLFPDRRAYRMDNIQLRESEVTIERKRK